MRCRQCGAEIAPDAKFCSSCGTPVDDADKTSIFRAVTEEAPPAEPVASEDRASLAPGNALLVLKRGTSDGDKFLIDQDVTTVGRHPDSDIFLDDITVSRHHCKFVRAAGRLYIEDLGSLNGTRVNRSLIDGRAQVHNGDEIQVGKYRASVVMGEPGST